MKRTFFILTAFFLLIPSAGQAETPRKTGPSVATRDLNKDGKPDAWIYSRGGLIYKREWDRNFDGKPDLRMYEADRKLIAKEYDDNFDGRFEKMEKAPPHGSSGRTKTRTNPIPRK